MMKRRFPVAALALAVLASCAPKGVETRPTIQYVRNVIAGHGPEKGIVEAFDPASATGPVCIVGSSERCAEYRTMMERCDMLDNVTGRANPDGLPDFSGEMILTIADGFRVSDIDSLRERTVRVVISALDTVYFLSEFDKVGLGKRPASKIVLLADPEMTSYGKFDADTLFKAFDKANPVVSPLSLMLEKVLDGADGPVNVGILCDTSSVSDSVLCSAFEDAISGRKGVEGSVLYVGAAPADSSGTLMSYLDSYVAEGFAKPLSAIIVLSTDADVTAMRKSLSEISVPLSDAFLAYGSVVTPSFRILEARESAALECL